MADWVVSHCDVVKHPKYKEDGSNLELILKDYGMNIEIGFYKDNRDTEEKPENWPEDEPHFGYTHRSPFTGKICTGPRYIGQARSDGKWGRFVSDFLELQAT